MIRRLNSIVLAAILSHGAFANEHEHGDHQDHNHQHTPHLRRLNPFGAPPGLCKDDDPTYTVGGVTYECQAHFNDAGGQCRTPDPSAEDQAKAKEDFEKWKENKEKGNGPNNRKDVRHRALQTGCPNSDCVDWTTDVITIPTWFHIIHDGNKGYQYRYDQSPGYIQESIKVMNRGFRGMDTLMGEDSVRNYPKYINTSRDTKIQFCLAGTTATNSRTYYSDRQTSTYKKALRQGGYETLNVWANLASGYLGYATFPGGTLSNDGVVILNDSMPGPGPNQVNSAGGIYGYGDTLTHEVGHWLMLYHTHQNRCNGQGDYMSEKATENGATFDCKPNLNNCDESGANPGGTNPPNPIHNFMSYVNDACMDEFSPAQVPVAQAAWENYRHKPGYSESVALDANGYSCLGA